MIWADLGGFRPIQALFEPFCQNTKCSICRDSYVLGYPLTRIQLPPPLGHFDRGSP